MKTLRIGILLSLAISLLILGCSKEHPDNINVNSNTSTLKSSDMEMLYLIYQYDDWGNYIGVIVLGCWWPPDNCLPTVVITGSAPNDGSSSSEADPTKTAYDDFICQFQNNNVDEFFASGDYLTLFPELNNMPDVVTGLSNSDIILYHEVGEDGFDYYIGLSDGTDYSSDWIGNESCVFVIDDQSQ
ncbi:MAG: hypothetical protein B6D64_00885 [Bacteroidetes bacterium 4484_276]|nr:MAG: hypothetical protein B6D64_00885 [Bacteroidetes bacterium 4484_276]